MTRRPRRPAAPFPVTTKRRLPESPAPGRTKPNRRRRYWRRSRSEFEPWPLETANPMPVTRAMAASAAPATLRERLCQIRRNVSSRRHDLPFVSGRRDAAPRQKVAGRQQVAPRQALCSCAITSVIASSSAGSVVGDSRTASASAPKRLGQHRGEFVEGGGRHEGVEDLVGDDADADRPTRRPGSSPATARRGPPSRRARGVRR